MKNIKLLLLLSITGLFIGCEDVVHVNLDTAPPRLVIEAAIVWDKGTAGNEQTIKLSTTTGYYDTVIPTVSNAVVTVEASDGTIFNFLEEENSGQYICTDFVPVLNETYHLTVALANEVYTATETMQSVVSYDYVEQINDGGFLKDQKEVRVHFTDPIEVDNYYLTQTRSTLDAIGTYSASDDEFFDGNQIYDRYTDEDLASGHVVTFKLYGISKGYYNYLNVLLNTLGNNPFQPPSGIVRGNITNTTRPENYCLGFFSLSEADNLTYNVQ